MICTCGAVILPIKHGHAIKRHFGRRMLRGCVYDPVNMTVAHSSHCLSYQS